MNLTAARRLRLRDILILQVSSPTPEEEQTLSAFAAELGEITRTPIVILNASMTLESLSESEMRAAGWVRAPSPNGRGG